MAPLRHDRAVPLRDARPGRVSGLYALHADGEFVYIGHSTNIGVRLTRHRRHAGRWVDRIRAAWLAFDDVRDAREVERMIAGTRYWRRPAWNRTGYGQGKHAAEIVEQWFQHRSHPTAVLIPRAGGCSDVPPFRHEGSHMEATAHPRRARNPHCARLIEVARQIVERLPDQDLKGAFLFGSAAWGDADAASDLDIMVLLDRPPGFREVTRRRAADLLGLSAPLPDSPPGPRFIDLDRFSAAAFAESAARGGPAYRLAHSVILRDADGFLARLRAAATADLADAAKRAARFRQRHNAATAARSAAREALAIGDPPLAALHCRLAVQEAASGLIELTGDRVSVTHFVESATAALRSLGRADLAEPFLRALALDAPPEALRAGIARSLRAYRAFADALKRWMDDPSIAGRLSAEDAAWAVFTWCDETYEEIDHKVETFTALDRLPTLQYYLDGLLTVPVRINFGKLFRLRATGESGRLSIPEFHAALRDEPPLLAEWVEALRLNSDAGTLRAADDLTAELLAAGDTALAAPASRDMP